MKSDFRTSAQDWLFETVEGLADGFIAVDLDWSVLYVNAAGERLLGRTLEALRGENLWEQFRDLEGTALGESLRSALQNRARVEIEDYFSPSGGWVEARACPTTRGLSILLRDITARRRAEASHVDLLARESASRREAERQKNLLDRILETSGTGIIVSDATGTLRVFNAEAERQHGASKAEVTAPEWTATFGLLTLDGAPLPLANTPLFRAVQGEEVRGARWRVRRPDGAIRTLAGIAKPLRTADGDPDGAVLVTEDVTALEEAAEKLLESERLFRALVENLPSLAWTARPDGHIDYYNRRWYEYTGTDYQGMQGWGWRSVHDPEALETVVSRWQSSLSSGDPFEMEFRLRRADGEFCWFLTRAYPLRDASGRIARWFGQNTDIDSQKRSAALHERRARQALLAGDIGAALTQSEGLRPMLQKCAEAIVRHLDAAFARIWTVEPEETVLVLQASAGLYTHLDGGHARVPVGRFKIGLIAQEAAPHLTNDVANDPRISDPRWAAREGMTSFAGYPLILEGQVIGVLAMFARSWLERDTLDALAGISDAVALGIQRRRSDEARRVTETRYRLATRATKDAIWDWDLITNRIQWNEGLYGLFGYAPEDVRDDAGWWYENIHPQDREGTVHGIHEVIHAGGQRWQSEYRFAKKGGGYAFVTDRGFISHDDQGRSIRMVGAMQDMTAQKKSEQERESLIRSLERSNNELDQFAYVTSHDLKAPLRGIANLSEWLEEDLGDLLTDESRQQMHLLRGRVHRLEGLINGILSYSRAGRARDRPVRVDVAKLVDEVVELLSPEAGTIVEVRPGMPTLVTERVPLQQVFLNLLGNAFKHARGEGARVEVGSEDGGHFWQFFVRDNGPGIAPKFHERIWGIFQTLEARDKVEGTGIGLSVVRKIAAAKGGHAWVESEEGRGATFRFTWPKEAEAKEEEPS